MKTVWFKNIFLAFIVVGILLQIIIFYLLHTIQIRNQNINLHKIEMVKNVNDIKFNVAQIHLWTTEYTSGDDIELDKVNRYIKTNKALFEYIFNLENETIEHHVDNLEEHAAMMNQLYILEEQFENFVKQTRNVLEFNVKVGTEIDKSYDLQYFKFVKTIESYEKSLRNYLENTNKDLRKNNKYVYILMGCIVIGALILFYLFFRQEIRRNEKREMQKRLYQEQTKLAQMGSMIGNIAHQWRQPLSQICTISSGIQLQNDMGTASKDQVNEGLQTVVNLTEHLSQTINTFRNFLKEDKYYQELIIQDRIDLAIDIVKFTLQEKNIELIKNIDYENKIHYKLPKGELVEVLINIINNAVDVLVENKIDSPWIKIELMTIDSTIVISIEDNAGGIPIEVIPNIFKKYYTTKSKGTGLGLHMSYDIITKSMNGKLDVKNSENGAKFTIQLPLK